ncbi:MAG: ABC transporter ATP-binding protein [Saprospiraceae bacterium]|nr:ABC transporter ATP-binding protein [Candidatus Vicinibacter affinis]MBK8641190.1 ABC transporter ATP-binding protein [Candidatus Vicinibacter affinis]MBK9642493.1 ABC transporter ATP-binding protein [Candidatus Vicinibacter affinis]MBK9960197.1 ABC transporter ATP-binding protein [Candidatus Vicinibacter affinis]HQX43195.1 ABC transporter ATP-binding protein [Saprospiraceae bacterium]
MSDSGNNFFILRRLFGFTKPYRSILWTSTFLAILLAPLNALTPYLTHLMVDNHIMKADLPGLQKMALLFVLVLITTTGLRYLFTILTNTLGQNVIKDIRNKVFAHLLGMKLAYFDKTPVGTNTTRTVNDLESVNVVFAEGLITIMADVLGLLTILGMMFYTSVKLTFISLVSFPLLLIASYIFKEKVKVSYQRVRTEVARMNSFLQEHISGMRIVQIFTAEKKIAAKFKSINKTYTRANLDGIFYYAVFFPVVEIISAASLGFMVWWGAKGVLGGAVTVGQLVAFPMFIARLFQPVRMLADKFNSLQMGLIAGGRIFHTLDNQEKDYDSGNIHLDKLKGEVVFDRVSFSYDGITPVLNDISFTLEAGKSLAIVGSTGSGKSTMISILNRLYEVENGVISIDGINIKEYDLETLRGNIGLVLQDVFLFYGSVYDNISLNNPNISHQQIEEASKTIGADIFFKVLPGGYEYQVTERGSNLSMGQRQLISFVRALVYQPNILILDEATSSIDNQTEAIIQNAIDKLTKGRTSIIIAHRLSTIKNVDKILVLEKGKIVESGSQQELLAHPNGLFSRLYLTHFDPIQA